MAAGGPSLIDATDVSRHIRELLDDGYSPTAIAMVAGVDRTTVANLAAGRYRSTARGAADKLRAVTAAVILREVPGDIRVPAIGAHRRIRALQTLGWSSEAISRSAGLNRDTIERAARHPDSTMPAASHRAITQAYDRLSMHLGPSDRTRNWAKRGRHVPPLAWDDDEIDSATARPHNPNDDDNCSDERDEAIIDLTRRGKSARAIADIVGCSDRTVVRTRKRSRAAA